MGLFSYIERIYARSELMDGMFSRLGVRGWFAQDPHGPEVLRRAVLRCASCDHAEECAQWLGAHETARHAPDFCENRGLIERIARDGRTAA